MFLDFIKNSLFQRGSSLEVIVVSLKAGSFLKGFNRNLSNIS